MTGFFFARGDIYEDTAHHNAVFVGRDEDGIPRYAHSKGTAGNFRLDVKGSDKAFNFCYRARVTGFLSLKPPLTCSLSSACSKGMAEAELFVIGRRGRKSPVAFPL